MAKTRATAPLRRQLTSPSRRQLMQGLAALAACSTMPLVARGAPISVPCRDPEAARLLLDSLKTESFWNEASVRTFDDQAYETVHLRDLDGGYLARISGEGTEDYQHQTVVETVFNTLHRLPEVEDGAKTVVRLGDGIDPVNGLAYVDSFYFVDLSLMYGTYAQRMYLLPDGNRTLLPFERLTPAIAGKFWDRYQVLIKRASKKVNKRALFNAVYPVSDIFGMYVVEPGKVRTSRVTLIARLKFGEKSGLLARIGSDMPPVIRAGLRSGFDSCCALASQLETG